MIRGEGGWGHGISWNIEEISRWNSCGQLEKQCNFQGWSMSVTQFYRISKSKALFCLEFTRVNVELLGVIKKTSSWILISLGFRPCNLHGVWHNFIELPRVKKDVFWPDLPRVKWQTWKIQVSFLKTYVLNPPLDFSRIAKLSLVMF